MNWEEAEELSSRVFDATMVGLDGDLPVKPKEIANRIREAARRVLDEDARVRRARGRDPVLVVSWPGADSRNGVWNAKGVLIGSLTGARLVDLGDQYELRLGLRLSKEGGRSAQDLRRGEVVPDAALDPVPLPELED